MGREPQTPCASPLFESLEVRRLLSAGLDIVLVDNQLSAYEELADAASNTAYVVVYDGAEDSAGDVIDVLEELATTENRRIGSLSILSHGERGGFALGNEWISNDTLAETAWAWRGLAESFADGANIYIFGCNVASDSGGGRALLDSLADLTGADVFASDDLTGQGGDWVLEAASHGGEWALATGLSIPLDTGILWEYSFSLNSPPVSNEFRVNTTTDGDQDRAAVAMDASGNFVVVWKSGIQDPDGSTGIYAQRYNAAGVAQSSEFRVNTTTDGDQDEAAVAMDASGNFVVVWTSGIQDPDGSAGIYAQRYNAAGVAQGNEFRVNTTTDDDQDQAAVAMDADGNFVIVWKSWIQVPNGAAGIYGQRYNAAGVAQDSEVRVNRPTDDNHSQPAVAMAASDNIVVVWTSGIQDPDGSAGIYGQRFRGTGPRQGREFRVNTTTDGDQDQAAVAMDASGNFVIVWQSRIQDPDGSAGIYAQRYRENGVAEGSEFRVNTTTDGDQDQAAVAMDASGNFVVVWTSGIQDSDGSAGIYAQRYNAAGVAQGSEFRVNTTTDGDQDNVAVAIDSDGEVVVVWTSGIQDPDGSAGVYGALWGRPIVTIASGDLNYIEDDGAVAVDSGLTVTDVNHTDLAGATVSISSGYVSAEDFLSFVDQLGIRGNWDVGAGVLTLSGMSSVANYQTALRWVTYTNISDAPNMTGRIISFIATDGKHYSDQVTRGITITATNDAPSVSDDTFSIAEDAANDDAVGAASASDPDAGDSLTYSITAGNGDGVFAINSSTGQITVADNSNLDRETTTSYALIVQVEDTGALIDTATITVNVTDINDTTPVITASQSFAVAENAADTISVGTALATDADTSGSLQSWTITAGNGDGIFAINSSTGEITVTDNSNLDRETTASYTLTLTVGDGVNTSATETVTISVTDVNEAPTVSDGTFSIGENAANADVVGAASASDVDAGDSLTYSITAGNGDGVFAINSSTGQITVADNTNLDYETTTSYALAVQVEDTGALTDTATITVNVTDVTDVNEAPTIDNQSLGAIDENLAGGTSVATVIAADPDAGDSLTWFIISGNMGNAFVINSSTGEITVNNPAALDYEASQTFSLTVQVQDAGGLTDEATVTIDLNNLADTADDYPSEDDAATSDAGSDLWAGDLQTPRPNPAAQLPDIPRLVDTMPAVLIVPPPAAPTPEQPAQDESQLDAPRPDSQAPANPDDDRSSPDDAAQEDLASSDGESQAPVEPAPGDGEGIAETSSRQRPQAPSDVTERSQAIVRSVRANREIAQQVAAMKGQMDDSVHSQERKEMAVAGATTGVASSLTAGYVAWSLKTASLSASTTSAEPLWRGSSSLAGHRRFRRRSLWRRWRKNG
ncbi:MAG TPA: DUF4347 domain-containing protein [Phycisphaerae bacterium]|nr:DUF4347 domain-containing protein [Phycisphaerae bacterium]HDZ43710.1 DUF4347 domain-containing protein [Phycisphaerae bacterium]